MLKATDALRRGEADARRRAALDPNRPSETDPVRRARARPPPERPVGAPLDADVDREGRRPLRRGGRDGSPQPQARVAARRRRLQGRDPEQIEEELAQGSALLEELQHSVIQMRTLPLSSITGSFPRAVRDLAAAQGKQVELDDQRRRHSARPGDPRRDLRVDRPSAQQRGGARNRAARRTRAAPASRPRGRVELRGDQRGSLVAIEVRDDGRGVARELLHARRTATARSPTHSPQAGFSTAEEVTEVSGRGVGLDAVKSHVESLGGGLEVQQRAGAGNRGHHAAAPDARAAARARVRARRADLWPAVDQRRRGDHGDATRCRSRAVRPSTVRGRSVPLADLADVLGAPRASWTATRTRWSSPPPAGGWRSSAIASSRSRRSSSRASALCSAGVPGYLGARDRARGPNRADTRSGLRDEGGGRGRATRRQRPERKRGARPCSWSTTSSRSASCSAASWSPPATT